MTTFKQRSNLQIDKETMLAPLQPNTTVVGDGDEDDVTKGFSLNHPTCISCGGSAIPQYVCCCCRCCCCCCCCCLLLLLMLLLLSLLSPLSPLLIVSRKPLTRL